MKIELKNIGIVKEAQVEISGITVAAGLNASGKTTLGKGIFSSINAYQSLYKRVLSERSRSIIRVIDSVVPIDEQFDDNYFDFYEKVDNFMRKWVNDKKDSITKEELYHWFQGIKDIREDNFDSLLLKISEILKRSDDDYIKYLVESYYLSVFREQINCFYNDDLAQIRYFDEELIFFAEFNKNELTKNYINGTLKNKAIYIESHNILDLFSNRYQKTEASKHLFSLLKQEKKEEKIYEDYINTKEIKNIITKIENEVTHGRLETKSFSNIVFYDKELKQPVKIGNLSAGVKIFAVIQKLLENNALNRGDLLLIDEPEINLHPEWQVVFAEILVLLQKELGIYIYINSHSPYFIRALEVKIAEHGIADKSRFYLLKKDEGGICTSFNVSENTEEIYSLLYKPLENL